MNRLIILSFTLLIIYSCGDKAKTNQEKILGTWVGNLCEDKVNLNTDTFIFTSSNIIYKSKKWSNTVNGYTINQNSILHDNYIIFDLYFNSDVSLKLSAKTGIDIDDIYCLNKK